MARPGWACVAAAILGSALLGPARADEPPGMDGARPNPELSTTPAARPETYHDDGGPVDSGPGSAWPGRAGRRNLREEGGGEATEAAVQAGLLWLKAHQSPEGSFSA